MTWVRSGMAIYGLGYEMVWDESAWVRNDLIPLRFVTVEDICSGCHCVALNFALWKFFLVRILPAKLYILHS